MAVPLDIGIDISFTVDAGKLKVEPSELHRRANEYFSPSETTREKLASK